ncbi:MAG TPA: DUF6055 domain-containing protein [Abditibacteriaceae bacterium]|jgi:hypothetical protein
MKRFLLSAFLSPFFCVLNSVPALAQDASNVDALWQDNERKFKSDDPQYNFRRSEHFRIFWGKGAAKNKDENADFGRVTEQIAQGNLQMLERVWRLYHAPVEKGGLGIPTVGGSGKADEKAIGQRVNLMMNNTGIWAGGAWGSMDDWGYPIFALPPTYLAFDPPSGATPHEYGHTAMINMGGFNDTPWDGMWHEASANWVQLQFINSYSGPGAVGTQPYLSLPHGRNYYDCWQIYEYFRETPAYGPGFYGKLWKGANGNKKKGGEYFWDAVARLDTAHAPDSYNATKDAIGKMSARNVMWDYERQVYFQKNSPRTRDPFNETYRRAYTELVRRQGDTKWYRVPFAHAPMQGGFNVQPIALNGKRGGGYVVSIEFKPLWDVQRRSDWRATLVAVNDNGECRYSAMWNGGVNTITLSSDENRLYLCVAATPDFMAYDGFSHPLISDLPLSPQAYEVAFINTKAGPYESKPARPNVPGKAHPNGGGFVADSAKVAPTAYIGPNAMVLGNAQVQGNARLEDFAAAIENAVVKDNALLSGHALVRERADVGGNAKVRDWATVQGSWKLSENARALERAFLLDRGEVSGSATVKGATADFGGAKVSGYAIKEGDCANGANITKQLLTGWVWGTDQKHADSQPDIGGIYCNFRFDRPSPIYARDRFGVLHGYLMGAPRTVKLDEKEVLGALQLNGVNQYVELRRDVADFRETTYALWAKWNGGAGQELLHFGDGGKKYLSLTPQGADGKLKLTISDSITTESLTAPNALALNRWTHVALTFKGNTTTLYVDGVAVAEAKSTLRPDAVLGPNTQSSNEVTFLGRGARGGFFKGLIADFRVYSLPQESSNIATLPTTLKKRDAMPVEGAPPAKSPAAIMPKFLQAPRVVDGAVVMSAQRPPNLEGVEYRFGRMDKSGINSAWISSNRWTDCTVEPGRTYSYLCKIRRKNNPAIYASTPVKVTIPALPKAAAKFEQTPRGLSSTSIRMTAANINASNVEYRFARDKSASGAWQSSRTFTDKNLSPGSTHSYTVQARVAGGAPGPISAPQTAIARDDSAPTRYRIGEWQTYPLAMLDNTLLMKARGVRGENDSPIIETEPVEYYFDCVKGNGPDSGWILHPVFKTSALPDGDYVYQFKIRDTSPQRNETPYSSAEVVTVSAKTGYHPFKVADLSAQDEGTLVSVSGKITSVAPDFYTLSDGGANIKVMTQAVAGATNKQLQDKDVLVRGCVWIVSGEKRVTWAEVK